jgi:hypothetical protein
MGLGPIFSDTGSLLHYWMSTHALACLNDSSQPEMGK